MNKPIHELVVIGSGPGGYACAFRAADLGMSVTLIEKDANLGGVCLNRGCIPSKALLHVSDILNEARNASEIGVYFDAPKINIKKINSWKDDLVKNLSSGIEALAKRRKINIINGSAKFVSANEILVSTKENKQSIQFKKCVIATGSRSTKIPNIEVDGEFVLTSKDALKFKSVPEKMLIIGGGYIGLEMATFYKSIGSKIDVAEFLPNILSEMDKDLVQVLHNQLEKHFNIMLQTKVTSVVQENGVVSVVLENCAAFALRSADYLGFFTAHEDDEQCFCEVALS